MAPLPNEEKDSCPQKNGLIDQFVGSAKIAGRSETEKREAKLRVKISEIEIFDAKLRFALLASLRSAIFRRNEATNNLVTSPARVK